MTPLTTSGTVLFCYSKQQDITLLFYLQNICTLSLTVPAWYHADVLVSNGCSWLKVTAVQLTNTSGRCNMTGVFACLLHPVIDNTGGGNINGSRAQLWGVRRMDTVPAVLISTGVSFSLSVQMSWAFFYLLMNSLSSLQQQDSFYNILFVLIMTSRFNWGSMCRCGGSLICWESGGGYVSFCLRWWSSAVAQV